MILLVLIVSCDKNSTFNQFDHHLHPENTVSQATGPVESNAIITADNYHEFIREPKQRVKIWDTTPEEMNEFFIKRGLPAPNSEEDIRQYYARKREIATRGQFPDPCHLANLMAEMGDLNNDGYLSTIDVVLAYRIALAYPPIGYETCQATNASSILEFRIGMMEHMDWGSDDPDKGFELDRLDAESMRRAILYIICCD